MEHYHGFDSNLSLFQKLNSDNQKMNETNGIWPFDAQIKKEENFENEIPVCVIPIPMDEIKDEFSILDIEPHCYESSPKTLPEEDVVPEIFVLSNKNGQSSILTRVDMDTYPPVSKTNGSYISVRNLPFNEDTSSIADKNDQSSILSHMNLGSSPPISQTKVSYIRVRKLPLNKDAPSMTSLPNLYSSSNLQKDYVNVNTGISATKSPEKPKPKPLTAVKLIPSDMQKLNQLLKKTIPSKITSSPPATQPAPPKILKTIVLNKPLMRLSMDIVKKMMANKNLKGKLVLRSRPLKPVVSSNKFQLTQKVPESARAKVIVAEPSKTVMPAKKVYNGITCIPINSMVSPTIVQCIPNAPEITKPKEITMMPADKELSVNKIIKCLPMNQEVFPIKLQRAATAPNPIIAVENVNELVNKITSTKKTVVPKKVPKSGKPKTIVAEPAKIAKTKKKAVPLKKMRNAPKIPEPVKSKKIRKPSVRSLRIKRTSYWSKETMKLAMTDRASNNMSFRQLHRKYNIPVGTLQRHWLDQTLINSGKQKLERRAVFTPEITAELITAIQKLSTDELSKAFVITVRRLAHELVRKHKLARGLPSKAWYYNFLRQHPAIRSIAEKSFKIRRLKIIGIKIVDADDVLRAADETVNDVAVDEEAEIEVPNIIIDEDLEIIASQDPLKFVAPIKNDNPNLYSQFTNDMELELLDNIEKLTMSDGHQFYLPKVVKQQTYALCEKYKLDYYKMPLPLNWCKHFLEKYPQIQKIPESAVDGQKKSEKISTKVDTTTENVIEVLDDEPESTPREIELPQNSLESRRLKRKAEPNSSLVFSMQQAMIEVQFKTLSMDEACAKYKLSKHLLQHNLATIRFPIELEKKILDRMKSWDINNTVDPLSIKLRQLAFEIAAENQLEHAALDTTLKMVSLNWSTLFLERHPSAKAMINEMNLIRNEMSEPIEIVDDEEADGEATTVNLKSVDELPNVSFKCSQCSQIFKSATRLLRHTALKHSTDNPFKCDICNEGFRLRYSLHVHMRIHEKKKTYQCSKCQECFESMITLKAHKESHKETHKKRLEEKKVFKRKRLEMKASNKPKQPSTINQTPEKPERKSKKKHVFSCPICLLKFTNQNKLGQHLYIHKVEQSQSQRPVKCKQCEESFEKPSLLRRHVRLTHAVV